MLVKSQEGLEPFASFQPGRLLGSPTLSISSEEERTREVHGPGLCCWQKVPFELSVMATEMLFVQVP